MTPIPEQLFAMFHAWWRRASIMPKPHLATQLLLTHWSDFWGPFGHSLGLAQPFGSRNAFHNTTPIDGCLMDSGQNRPLEERGLLGDNPGTRYCGENLEYLQDILPQY